MNTTLDVLAIGAHPDDMELMCAGTLVKLANMGYKVGVCSLTAAELGTRGTPEIRRQESEQAAKIMGLSVYDILDIPDGQVAVTEAYKRKVIEVIRTYQPQIVFTIYWETRHPDHRNCSTLVREAAYLSGLKNINTGQQAHRPEKVIYAMELYDFDPSFVVDVSDSFEQKLEAIRAYKSQFFPQEETVKQGATYISTPEFLNSIVVKAEYWGNKIGVKYGEPFLIREPVVVNDPVAQFTGNAFAGLL